MSDKLHDISQRLDSIAEELEDLALDRLRSEVEAGATKASETDRRLARARRSVSKAAMLLRDIDTSEHR